MFRVITFTWGSRLSGDIPFVTLRNNANVLNWGKWAVFWDALISFPNLCGDPKWSQFVSGHNKRFDLINFNFRDLKQGTNKWSPKHVIFV